MMTLRQLAAEPPTIPTSTSWYLVQLGEALGKQKLFTRQSPQKLKALRENALIESAISSNRIEGVEVDRSRIGSLIFGKPALRDRGEEEVRGYRNALTLIHEQAAELQITEGTIRRLHKLCRGDVPDAGRYKEKDVDIIQKYADGRRRIRFRTVDPQKTPAAMAEMTKLWTSGKNERWVHLFILTAALNLDFLCIHPFRDGNGRVSRLLFLLACYHCGLEVGRYISLERLIKERYYEVLEQSSQGWHKGKHNPWPTINFLLFILTQASKEFEQRVEEMKSPRGAKTEIVKHAVDAMRGDFGITDLERACPGVSRDMIRRVLKGLKREDRVECIGRGPGAKWRKKGTTSKRGQ